MLAATYFYVYTVMQVPTGILVDTLGPRRILPARRHRRLCRQHPLRPGAVHAGCAGRRTLVGLGVSVTFIAMLKIIAVWFDEKHFATLTGICMLVGNLGSVLAGVPLSLTAQAIGWRSVFVGAGVLAAVWRRLLDLGARPQGWRQRCPPAEVRPYGHPRRPRQVLKNRATWPAALTQHRYRRRLRFRRALGDAVPGAGVWPFA